jgi:hypothetical protein
MERKVTDKVSIRTDHGQALVDVVDAMEPHADGLAEHLGLVIGAAYGTALAERDQARELADELGRRLALALTHLKAVLPVGVPTFAHDEIHVDAARTFLAEQLDSTRSPEQEPTT